MTSRLLAALVLAATTLLVPATAQTAQAAPGAPVRADEQAFSDIAGCISGADNVLVSIVVDESASLQQTDPGDLRVRGITTAIDSLDQLAATLGGSTELHVSLSTFARSFDTLVGWRRLDGGVTGPLRDAARSQLPQRNTGDATDYRQALQGASRMFDDRQRALGDPGACKVLLWFTDGALDVEEQTGAAASQLCQLGGIVDAVRRDGIAVVALALFSPGADVTEAQREQLRAVAEGRGSGVTCGTVPIPPQNTSGIYLPADDPAALQALFGRAGALVGGGTPVGTVSCPGPECPGGRYSLPLDPGVAGARLLIASRTPGGPDVQVDGPAGPVDLSDGEAEVDGATVTLIRRDGFATLDISYPRFADEPTVWQVRPGRSELTVFWFWGAQLELGTESVRAGERNDLALQLLDRTGAPLDPTLYDDFRVTAALGERDLTARITRDGTVTGSFDLGVEGLPPAMPLRVSVTARSRPGGVPLGPLSLSDRLPVELPQVYPSVAPDSLDFGTVEGEDGAATELTATGSRLGPTRVCVTGSEVVVPGRDPADLVTPRRDCVDLERDGEATIPLDLDPGVSADGLASGAVTLSLEPADGSAPLQVDVPLELEMQRVVDESTRWLLVALLVGLALLLPLLVLLVANWLAAAFVMTSLSRVGSAPVRITSRGLAARDGGELIGPDDFDNAGFSGRRKARRMALGHTGITADCRGAVGLRDAWGVAVGPEGRLLVSGMTPYRGQVDNEAPMALGDIDGTFVVVERTGTPEEAEGRLVVVVPGSVDNDGIRDRAQETSNRVDWEKVLAEAAPRRATVPTATSAATAGAAPARAQEPAGTDPAGAGQDDEREPFPWEDDAAPRSTPPARKSGSWGKRRRSASDSSQGPSPGPTPRPTPRPTQKDGDTHPGGRSDPADDDGLPPLPDFLEED
jgi:hypothetical protein